MPILSGIIRKGTKENPGTGLKIRPSLSVGATSIYPASQVMYNIPLFFFGIIYFRLAQLKHSPYLCSIKDKRYDLLRVYKEISKRE